MRLAKIVDTVLDSLRRTKRCAECVWTDLAFPVACSTCGFTPTPPRPLWHERLGDWIDTMRNVFDWDDEPDDTDHSHDCDPDCECMEDD